MKLSAVKTKIRKKTIRQGECLIWQGATDGDGIPRMRDDDGKNRSVRRILMTAMGVDLTGKLATTTCDNSACVCDKHAAAWTRKELQARSAKKQTGNVALSMKRAINGRRTAKLDLERVREMRASGLSQRQAAIRYGVSLRTAQKILRGEAWREYGTPWAGLPQASTAAAGGTA